MKKRNRSNSMPRVFPWIDLILFLLLTGFGTWVIVSKPWALDPASAAALSGSMYGGAALLLGNWINRLVDWHRTTVDAAQRVEKLKALIAAELVDVAIGLMDAKQLMDAAINSLTAGGPVSTSLDMSRYRPRAMSLTENLGTDLLMLETVVIDALATLRTNLTVTRQAMDDITFGANFGLLRATELSNGLGHDMTVLSQTIQHVAPDRKLQMPGNEPELLTRILERSSRPRVIDRVPPLQP